MKKLSVAITTALCLIFIAYVAKFFSDKQYDFILSNLPFFVFFIYLINSNTIELTKKNLILWNGAVILATIGVTLVLVL